MKIIPRQNPKLLSGAVKLFLNLLREDKLLEGEYIKQFEAEFAKYTGVKHAILVSSGRLALYLILKYFNIGDGDEVILPAFTCPVVPSTIASVGARPVFVDVELETFNSNPSLIEQCVTKNTKVFYKNFFCSPCLSAYNHRNSICTDNKCMQAISVQEVFDEAKRNIS